MTRPLFFVPLIERALRAPDPKAALVKALANIEAEGDDGGLEQFHQFMNAVATAREDRETALAQDVKNIVRQIMIELATDTFEGDDDQRQAALDVVHCRDAWRKEFEKLQAEVSPPPPEAPGARLAIILERNGKVIADNVSRSTFVRGIVPGSYLLRTHMGRVLWQQQLTQRDVIWSHAYPGQPLSAAAQTDGPRRQPTLEATLLEGRLVVRVLPGVENGVVELELARAENG